jgi:hypothetical protein
VPFPVHCTNCGQELPSVEAGPCPKCGAITKTVQLEARGHAQATASAQGSWRRVEEVLERNWLAMSILFCLILISAIPAYFLSGWWSVSVTLALAAISSVVGVFAVTKVRNITEGKF